MLETPSDLIRRAAEAIAGADALLIGAGAGMGVDSGLPDFRGAHGFWRAYPPYAQLGLGFTDVANPRWFRHDPTLAWGFYGHRLGLYRQTRPHAGFELLRRWADRMREGAFVYTSNVDGQFQVAGFDPSRIVEVHGAIGWMQCTRECGIGPFPADPYHIEVDEATMRAVEPLPACPNCDALARPNILMFGDGDWDDARTHAQRTRFREWLLPRRGRRLVLIECGAGTAIPTVRMACEDLAEQLAGTLIRINPREPDVPEGQIALPLGSLEALQAIDAWFEPGFESISESTPSS
jgi:NAD-dependent SIR2 family protein deacetylase